MNINFLVNEFTTDDSNCPIESYEATNLSNGIKTGLACPTPPNLIAPCRKLIIN